MNIFEMLKTSNVKQWVRDTNRDGRELDVREMFPRLPRGNVHNVFHRPPLTGSKWCYDSGVWEAIQSQGLWVWEAQGRRFTKGAPWVALSDYSKKWDHLGKRYDAFTNISWTEICNYMKCDLFFNDMILGGQVIRQKRGVAIRGMCSAHSASIYCMQRKHFWHHQQAGTGLPWDLNHTVAGRQCVSLS